MFLISDSCDFCRAMTLEDRRFVGLLYGFCSFVLIGGQVVLFVMCVFVSILNSLLVCDFESEL